MPDVIPEGCCLLVAAVSSAEQMKSGLPADMGTLGCR